MRKSKHQKPSLFISLCFIIFLMQGQFAMSQNIKQTKMEELSFMIGDWVGNSKVYENGKVIKEVPAYQKISYDLEKSIIVIELKSESLQLHTVIYYNENDKRYSYNPFSKNGARSLPADYKDGQLVVSSGETKRFIFGRTSEGGFREYGEELIDGKWVKYFEDNFKNVQ